MPRLEVARKGARAGAIAGFGLGIVYFVGGFIIDLLTIGLNSGTALAFLALLGMPAIFGTAGFLVGLIFSIFRTGLDDERSR